MRLSVHCDKSFATQTAQRASSIICWRPFRLPGLPRRPRQSLDTVLTHYCHSAKNFDFNLRRDHQKNFLWASRLWVGRRKEPILGYVPKKYERKNSGSNGLSRPQTWDTPEWHWLKTLSHSAWYSPPNLNGHTKCIFHSHLAVFHAA